MTSRTAILLRAPRAGCASLPAGRPALPLTLLLHPLGVQVRELQRQGNASLVMALTGNKADLTDKRKVEAEVRAPAAHQPVSRQRASAARERRVSLAPVFD